MWLDRRVWLIVAVIGLVAGVTHSRFARQLASDPEYHAVQRPCPRARSRRGGAPRNDLQPHPNPTRPIERRER